MIFYAPITKTGKKIPAGTGKVIAIAVITNYKNHLKCFDAWNKRTK